jgi:hypothetical protein
MKNTEPSRTETPRRNFDRPIFPVAWHTLKMTTQTNLLTLLTSSKPELFTNGDAPVKRYKEVWYALLSELPEMYKRGEEWATHHRARDCPSFGTDAEIQQEFQRFESLGMKVMDDTEANNQNIYVIIPHPKYKKVVLRCEFSFYRYLGTERPDGSCLGAGLCPWLFAIGVFGDGITYVKVKFNLIRKNEIPRDEQLITLKSKNLAA